MLFDSPKAWPLQKAVGERLPTSYVQRKSVHIYKLATTFGLGSEDFSIFALDYSIDDRMEGQMDIHPVSSPEKAELKHQPVS